MNIIGKIYQNGKPIIATALLALNQMSAMAQDTTTISIDKEEVTSWFSQNWMWVVIGAVVLILIIALVGSGRKKSIVKKTTIVKEEDPGTGVVKTTTTKEIE